MSNFHLWCKTLIFVGSIELLSKRRDKGFW